MSNEKICRSRASDPKNNAQSNKTLTMQIQAPVTASRQGWTFAFFGSCIDDPRALSKTKRAGPFGYLIGRLTMHPGLRKLTPGANLDLGSGGGATGVRRVTWWFLSFDLGRIRVGGGA